MKTPIKILEIVTALNVDNGVTSIVMNYLRRLNHNEFIVDFAVCQDMESPYYNEIESYGGKVFVLPKITSLAKHIKACDNIYRINSYDIVHDNALTQSVFLMRKSKKHKIPVRILHSHSSNLGENKFKVFRNTMILHSIKSYSTHYFACSNKAGECYFANRDYKIIPNIVDKSLVKFSSEKRKLIRNKLNLNNKTVIGTVGRLSGEKNPFFALRVINELLKSNQDIVYLWIGSGPLDDELTRYINKLGIQDNVLLLGRRTDVNDLYHALDIFFLPSLFEGLPVTGIESQAMGLPSVISDTVTKELVYTDLIKYVPLDAPIEQWVEAIEEQMKRIPERRSYINELENSIFNASNAGDRLGSFYRQFYGEAN